MNSRNSLPLLIIMTANNSNIKIFYQNVRSLNNKLDDFLAIISSNSFHIICLTETWLCEDTQSSLEVPISLGWKVVSYSRPPGKKGGGVLILICPSFSISTDYISSNRELVFVILNYPFPLCISLLYNPPSSNVTDWDNIFEECIASTKPALPWLFLGDFNFPSWNKLPISNILLSTAMEHNLSQVIPFPTRADNFLDLIFVRLLSTSDIRKNNYFESDHIGVEFEILNLPTYTEPKASRLVHDYYRTNWLRINHLIADLTSSFISIPLHTPNTIDETIDKLITLIDKAIPKKKIQKFSLPWFDADLIALCKKKNRFHKIWKLRGNEIAYRNYSEIRSLFKKKLIEKRTAFIINSQKLYHTDVKKFWRIFKGTSSSNLSSTILSSNDFAEHFALLSREDRTLQYPIDPNPPSYLLEMHSIEITTALIKDIVLSSSFQSKSSPDILNGRVLRCCSQSLIPFFEKLMNVTSKLGYYPKAWKISSIFPLYKKGDKSDVKNYRQITIQPLMGKILDKIIYLNIYPHVLPLIKTYAHYGIKNRSINSNLICTLSFLLKALEERKRVDVVYLDIEKAFDNVSQHLLLYKLEHHFGFKGSLLELFRSFFSMRTSFVKWNDHSSDSFTISKGIPQGGILSPLLFVLFTNDLPCNNRCGILTYADDVKLLSARPYNSPPDNSLQLAIDELSNWTAKWGLSLNPTKTKMMTFSLKKSKSPQNDLRFCTINGTQIEIVDHFTDLGVIFDTNLTFSKHISNLNLKLRRSLGFMKFKYKSLTDFSIRKVLYNAFFQSKLDYGISIWGLACQSHINFIEKTHKRALQRFLLNQPYSSHEDYHISCKKAGILPIYSRYLTISVPLLINENIPHATFLTLTRTTPKLSLNTRSNNPFFIHGHRTDIIKRSLRISLPAFLNCLPSELIPTNPFLPIWKKLIREYILNTL